MKNIGARHDESVNGIKKIFVSKIDSGDFGRALHQYFSNDFAPIHPTLKLPLHAPAEKRSFFSKNDQRSRVFDYDCVTL